MLSWKYIVEWLVHEDEKIDQNGDVPPYTNYDKFASKSINEQSEFNGWNSKFRKMQHFCIVGF